jgi:soluble cytochrome b562
VPKRQSITGSELFIVDNSEEEWKALRYLHDWCQLSKQIDCATGHFEIGALLALKEEWRKVDQIRILMSNDVSARTRAAFHQSFDKIKQKLDDSIEHEKEKNDFLTGVPAIVQAATPLSDEQRRNFHSDAAATTVENLLINISLSEKL